jgi:hypothetical protein
MKNKGKIIMIIMVLMLLTGCTSEVSKGVIVEKRYQPSHYSTTYVMAGKIMVPVESFEAESYSLCVYGKSIQDGENKREWKTVQKEEYDKYNLGDEYLDQAVNKEDMQNNGNLLKVLEVMLNSPPIYLAVIGIILVSLFSAVLRILRNY